MTFLGAKTQPEVVALLREADLFVLPAKEAPSGDRDGLPNVLLEAASQGLAIVASDFSGIPEFIRDGVDGRLIPPGDAEALASAIEALARDPTARAALGYAAFRRLRRDFSAGMGLDGLARRFRPLLGEPATLRIPGPRGGPVTPPIPIAFYAPLKSPNHPAPSGDRTMARLLMKALRAAGFAPRSRASCAASTCSGDASVAGATCARPPRRRPTGSRPRAGARPERPAPLVHLPQLLQGPGLDRAARRARRSASPTSSPRARARGKRAGGPGRSATRGRRRRSTGRTSFS